MKTSSGSIFLEGILGNELSIVNSARISYAKQKDVFELDDKKLLMYLWKNRHTSPFEQVEITFKVTCPLPIAMQWIRHRTWSYNMLSRRYTSEGLKFHIPKNFRLQSKTNKQGSVDYLDCSYTEDLFLQEYKEIINKCEVLYLEMIKKNVCKEQARFILPQCLMTEFYAKVDLKNLLDFLMLRKAQDAQKEIQEFAFAIIDLLEPLLPVCMNLVKQGKWKWVEDKTD